MAIRNKDEGNSVSSRLSYIAKQLNDPSKTGKEIKVLKLREDNLLKMLSDDQETFEDGGKVEKPKKLPKPKPKIGDRNEMGPIYTDTKTGKKVKRLNKGGAAFPDLTGDGKVTQKDILKGRGVTGFRKGGKAIKESKFGKMGEALMGGLAKSLRKKTGNSISNADKAAVRKLVQETGNKTDRQIMQFEHGGEVRGMGRAYMGSSRKAKIR